MAVASRNGHSDLVDLLVKQYGCSISYVEKVKHVTNGMTCYHHSVMYVTFGMTKYFVIFLCLHLNSSSPTSLRLFSCHFASFSHEFRDIADLNDFNVLNYFLL